MAYRTGSSCFVLILAACSPSGGAAPDTSAGNGSTLTQSDGNGNGEHGTDGSADGTAGSGGVATATDPGASGTLTTGANDDQRWLKYIRGDEYTRLEFEVDSVAGLAPETGASAPVLAALSRTLDKSGGIELRADGEIEPRGA